MKVYVIVRKTTAYCSLDDNPNIYVGCNGVYKDLKSAMAEVNRLYEEHSGWSMQTDEFNIEEQELS